MRETVGPVTSFSVGSYRVLYYESLCFCIRRGVKVITQEPLNSTCCYLFRCKVIAVSLPCLVDVDNIFGSTSL